MNFWGKTAVKNALSGLCSLAGTSFFAACQTPPSPEAREDGAELALEYAVFEQKEKKDFARIPEFFTDEEFFCFSRVVRSDPETRAGVYLCVGLGFLDKIPAGSKATLRYFRPDRTGEQVQTFTLPSFTGTPVGELWLGLTGEAWPSSLKGKRPTAWKLTIHAPGDEKLLVARSSFLWALPKTEKSPAGTPDSNDVATVPAEPAATP